MKYLLDTCTVSDFVTGQPSVLARIKATPPNLIGVSALTRMEVDYGLALNTERAKKLAPILDAFFRLSPRCRLMKLMHRQPQQFVRLSRPRVSRSGLTMS